MQGPNIPSEEGTTQQGLKTFTCKPRTESVLYLPYSLTAVAIQVILRWTQQGMALAFSKWQDNVEPLNPQPYPTPLTLNPTPCTLNPKP